MKYYQRQIQEIIKEAARQFRVVVLTGARQTGKSTLLKHLFSKTHEYVTFDNPHDLKLAQEDPELFFEQYKKPLILDEIQYVPELLRYIKLKVDKSSARGQFIITGSQQFTLMKGIRETLAGRVALFELFPMSFEEGNNKSKTYEFRALKGSYPELITTKNISTNRWYSSYISTYLEKDVQIHYHLEKIRQFRNFLFLLASRCAQLLNYQSLANDLGVSITAVKAWTKILEASQIIYLLKPYYVNLGSRIVKSPKVYFADIGLVSYIVGVNNKTNLYRGIQAGALYENFVIQEIVKYYSNLGKISPIYYYRTNNGLEIDLVIEEKQGKLIPCEIKISKTPNKSMVQSIERLRKFNKKKTISISDGCVICLVSKSICLSKNAKAYNLNEFLTRLRNRI